MISSLEIYQDNKIGDSNLMAVHSPLVFLIDANYSTTDPYFIYCKLYDGETLLNTFRCIPYKDLTTTKRRFMFIADSILRGYMEGYDDFVQSSSSLAFVEDITKEFTLVFSDPDGDADDVSLDIVAMHGVSQFGENQNKVDIFSNESEIIIAANNKPCYVYFYNDDITNEISVDEVAYIVTFVVKEGSSFLDGVSITINGETKETNTSGEAKFNLKAGTYSYSIEKDSYIPQSGDLTINNNVILNISLAPATYVNLTVITGYGNDLVKIYDQNYQVLDPRTALDEGYTDAAGEVVFEVYNNQKYWIDVDREHKLCSTSVGGTRDDEVDVLEDDITKYTTDGVAIETPTTNFIVKSALDSSFIENAELTEDGTDLFGNCPSGILYSNSIGVIDAGSVIKLYTLYDVRRDNVTTGLNKLYYHITNGYGVATGENYFNRDREITIYI